MVIHIQGGKDIKPSTGDEIQLMPFKIYADADAEVSKFFTPYVKVDEDFNYMGSFRGRPLVGRKLILPKGYEGLILNERIAPETENAERNFYITNKFESFVHWNWDAKVGASDPIMQVLDIWIDVAEAVRFNPVLLSFPVLLSMLSLLLGFLR
ncbi:hypothetical protein FQA39_LY12512 [Lamprigera yunnana]|nr:hypothetical protein FQA39_LY12512 [Lamprigera yunnana]